MARNFDRSTNLDLQAADAAVMHVAEPYAVAFWYKGNAVDVGNFQYLLSKLLQAGDHSSWAFSTNGTGDLRFLQGHGSTSGQFVVSPTIAKATAFDNAWHHLMGSADGTTVRIYLDGVEQGTGTAQVGATAYSSSALYVGSFDGATNALYYPGGLAEIAVFDAIPNASERAALAKGYSPLAVRPASVVMYWPLIGQYAPEIDLVGGVNLTNNGTIQANNSPRLIYPSRALVVPPASTGGTGATPATVAGVATIPTVGVTALPKPATVVGTASVPQAAFAGLAKPATVAGTASIPTPKIAPDVVAGAGRPVVAGGTVGLDVTATAPTGQTIGHSWSIISGGGSLTNATTATPTYTAPGSGSGLVTVRDTVTASGGGVVTADLVVSYAANIVAAENALTGTARATWDLADPNLGGITTLQGFADGFTRDKTQTVNFKIAQSDTAGWSAQVYRLGYYAGNGARLIDTLTPTGTQVTNSQAQPSPGDIDAGTTLLSADCANWSTTLTWTPPAWAPSGVYVLRLNRTGGGASHVMFVLRDDARTAALMLMTADSTWNAYNAFGGMGANLLSGNSLYFGTAVDQYNADCARFVSYNRPFVNRAAANTGQSYGAVEWSTFFTGEYPMVRFIERNGYDVKYYGAIDAAGDSSGAKLTGKVGTAMFVGHNEYWSNGMRAGWEAAKAAGVNIFSCAGNEVFWRTVGTDNDADGRPRTWECQKSTIGGRGNTRPEWTGTWRDPSGAGKGGDNPELSFTGTIFCVNGPDLRSLVVPFAGGYSKQPIWRSTSVASLTTGQTYTSPGQIVGFEWDTYSPSGVDTAAASSMGTANARAIHCSNVSYAISGVLLTDAGQAYGTGNAVHRLVVTPGGSGGMVFATGSVNWALGLDSANTYQLGNDNTDVVIQQATVNMLADMGASATTLMGTLTAPAAVDWFVDTAPATVVGVATIPQVGYSDTAKPATVAGTATIPQVGFSDTTNPATVAGAATIPQVGFSDTAMPATLAGMVAIAQVGFSDTAKPATVTGAATIPQVGFSDTAMPATVAGMAAIAQVGFSDTTAPATVAGMAAIAQVGFSDTTAPATVVGLVDIPAAAAQAGTTVTLTTVAGVAAIASPSVAAFNTPTPTTVAAVAALPAVTVLVTAPAVVAAPARVSMTTNPGSVRMTIGGATVRRSI